MPCPRAAGRCPCRCRGAALGVVGVEQRDELGIVTGLHGDRARGLVGRSVNLRGEPPTGASQRVIDPANIRASVAASRRSPGPTPGTWYTTASAARATGTSTTLVRFDIVAACSIPLSGTPLTPKSATPDVAWAMPLPEPTSS